MAALLEAHGLSFGYAKTPVVWDMDLVLNQGEILAVIGPNGSGKTTLLNLLSGLAKPDQGQILIKGEKLSKYSRRACARIMAYLSQQPPEDIMFTALETVLLGRSPHLGLLGAAREMDRLIAMDAMAKTKVDHLRNRRLDKMSGGERQRVFLAKALCQEPEILFLDEPTTFLDMTGQTAIMDIVRDLASEQGTGVAAVFHDVNLAAMYADRVLLMQKGRTLATGTPEQVLTEKLLQQAYQGQVRVEKSPHGIRVWPVPAATQRVASR